MAGEHDVELTRLSKDISALKEDSIKVQDGLQKIYGALTRLAVLEDNRKHTDESVAQLFKLYHNLKDKLTVIEASIATIGNGVKNNNQVSGWIIYAGVAVASSMATMLIASQLFKP